MDEFSFEPRHVAGTDNKVADALSRYYESDNADIFHPEINLMNADIRMNPHWEDLTNQRIGELLARRITRTNPEGLEPSCNGFVRHVALVPTHRRDHFISAPKGI